MSSSNTISQGFVVNNPDLLKQMCERVLRQALENRSIGFDELLVAGRNRRIYTLRGNLTSRARAKYNYSVIPVLQAPNGFFWLGATIELAFKQGTYSLEQVSLIIFHGEATDVEKTPLLRAEWDATDSTSRARHAQPHWHVYSSRLNRSTTSGFAEFTPEPEVIDFTPQEQDVAVDSSWEEGEKFHFAMASRWHLEDAHAHQESFEQEKLLKWLEGCVSYIRDQLIYIYQ